jgi:catechol 2,3-dioxygenase
MGVSTDEIFGNADGAQPATPGTYGQAPSRYRLPAGTRLGPVRLQIADLGRSIAFYETTLGMRVLHRDESRALLGARQDETPLVELRQRAGARPAPRRGRLGLYHFAILLPDRASLGRYVRYLAEVGRPSARRITG